MDAVTANAVFSLVSLPLQQALVGLGGLLACSHIVARLLRLAALRSLLQFSRDLARVRQHLLSPVALCWIPTTVGAHKRRMSCPIAQIWLNWLPVPAFPCSCCCSLCWMLQLHFTALLSSPAAHSTWSSRRSSASREQKHFPHILPGALAGLGRKQRLAGVSPRCCLALLVAPASRCTRFAGNSRCRLGGAELGFPRFPGPASGHSAWH